MNRPLLLTGAAAAAAICVVAAQERGRITPTDHSPVPAQVARFWLAPERPADAGGVTPAAQAAIARGVALVEQGQFAEGLPLVQNAPLAGTTLEAYGRYYTGVALLGLGRPDEAAVVFERLDDRTEGYLEEAVPLRAAEAALAAGHPRRAVDILDDLKNGGLVAPEEALIRLGAALEADGHVDRALDAYRRVYYEFPLSTQASAAQAAIERLETPSRIPSDRYRRELERAEALFQARRWAQARAAYVPLSRAATGNDRDLIGLRLAQCDFHLDRHRAARDALRPYLDSGPRRAEARFFYLSAIRALGDRVTYVSLARRLAADYPDSPWAEEALNNLASHYITANDDAEADRVFRELARLFPRGRYADRAAWRIGWRAYKQGRFPETASTFEAAAVAFPRADYRPSWLYWAARSRDRMGDRPAATALYAVVAADYLNSYYGRLASAVLSTRSAPPIRRIAVAPASSEGEDLVPNGAVIRSLGAAGLYDQALLEVEYARRAWGDSVPLQATTAWIRHQRAFSEDAAARFADLRGAITLMRRAYPQFMAAGGEDLPPAILQIIFPIDYWPLIRKYSEAHRLDPYLMTALIAQESTFTADVRSSANAVGLMQLIPGTAQRYAARLGMPYSSRLLTEPEANIRMGMRYFRDLMDRFGAAHYALASYNAGEQRIARWIAERPGLQQDEFIDDIPFPETQNYVKRILGTAEDYRRLYGGGVLSPAPVRR